MVGLMECISLNTMLTVFLEPFDSSPWQWWDGATAQAYDAANGTSVWATR